MIGKTATRPMIGVRPISGETKEPIGEVKLPAVFTAPIRPYLVRFVHTNIAKNRRQSYAVKSTAGEWLTAHSWGTGRAMARLARVSGSGTGRNGQGALSSMARGGRMFAPTKVWRKWNRKVNTNLRRYAICSAIAATGVASIVMARGHKIAKIPEVPLVVSDALESIKKTKEAEKFLEFIGALRDVEKVKDTKRVRAGQGKMRNRKYVTKRGPLIIYSKNDGIKLAFRNLPGVETCNVNKLNLLSLAPGAHLGRFCIFTESAFKMLDDIYGTWEELSKQKTGYKLPEPTMVNTDLERLINSDEIQSALNGPKHHRVRAKVTKKNPFTNKPIMKNLNPLLFEKMKN